jgi:hypothetical protein
VRRPPEAERQEGEAEKLEEPEARAPEAGEAAAGGTEDRAAAFIVSAASDETIAPGDETPEGERTEGGVVTLIVSPSADAASEAPQCLQRDAKSGLAVLQ